MPNNPNTFTPKEAADRIGITTQSVRRYCDRFSRFLSDTASPGPGATRQLTPEDIYVLDQIYRGTQRGLTYDQIEEELETLTLPDVVQLETEPQQQVPAAIPEGLAVLQQMATTLQTTQEALQALTKQQADISALHARIDTLIAVQEESPAQKEQRLAIERQTAAMERLANSIIWAVAALSIIVLLTLAVAAGWISQ